MFGRFPTGSTPLPGLSPLARSTPTIVAKPTSQDPVGQILMPFSPYGGPMASSTEDGSLYDGEIHLWREESWWIAKDVETGVTTQGESREAALANLDEAVALHNGEIGREPTDEELRELGIDPVDNNTGEQERPDVLK